MKNKGKVNPLSEYSLNIICKIRRSRVVFTLEESQLFLEKLEQAVYRLALEDKWQNNNLVFPNDFGAIMHQSISRRWLQEFCRKNDLPVVTVHGLRHANASLLISSGADVKTVSSTLGHSQTSTTLDIYAHSFATKQAEASQAVAELLTPRKRA